MGEAKRKAASRAWFADLAGAASRPDAPVAEVIWVCAGSLNFETALSELHGKCDLLTVALNDLLQQGLADRSGVEWIRWPSGRQQVRTMPSRTFDLRQAVAERSTAFVRRGVAPLFVNFLEGRVIPVGREIQEEIVARACERRAAAASLPFPLIERKRITDLWMKEGLQIVVGNVKGVDRDLVALRLIDELESMVGSKDSISRFAGTVALTFDGMSEDRREMWDVEEARDIVRCVAWQVRWWPLLINVTHAFPWLASCVEHGPTRYFQDGEVFVDFDSGSLRAFVQRCAQEASTLLAEAGFGADAAQPLLDRVVGPLVRFCNAFEQKKADVGAGRAFLVDQPAKEIDPLLWRAKFDGKSIDEMTRVALESRTPLKDLLAEVGSGVSKNFGIVLDRSPAGVAALELMRQAGPWWRAHAENAAVRAWVGESGPYLVLSGSRQAGSFSAIPCDCLTSVLDGAIPFSVQRAADSGDSSLWSVCVAPQHEVAVLGRLLGLGAIGRQTESASGG